MSDDLGVAVHFCRTVLKHGFFGGKQCIGFEFEALTAVLLGLFAATWFEVAWACPLPTFHVVEYLSIHCPSPCICDDTSRAGEN